MYLVMFVENMFGIMHKWQAERKSFLYDSVIIITFDSYN